MNFTVPCLLGLEAPLADELKQMGMASVASENGRVSFTGGPEQLAKANMALRTGERVLLQLGQFSAKTFEELFQGVAAIPWGTYIPREGAFPVTGHSLNSALTSLPACQRIIKKAAAEQLKKAHGVAWLEESGPTFGIRFQIMKDVATISLDTTGLALYKRGYRLHAGAAPLRETLAAAMVKIARYRGKEVFADPFCGSGTIAIEAALAARGRAPGLSRSFDAMNWPLVPRKIWDEVRAELAAAEYHGTYEIHASDIDPACIETARENARRAGVLEDISFQVADAADFVQTRPGGLLVTNPPYGRRILEVREAEAIYTAFGNAAGKLDGWKLYILSAHADFEQFFGRKANKKRKLYNGMIKCDLYMYL